MEASPQPPTLISCIFVSTCLELHAKEYTLFSGLGRVMEETLPKTKVRRSLSIFAGGADEKSIPSQISQNVLMSQQHESVYKTIHSFASNVASILNLASRVNLAHSLLKRAISNSDKEI